MANEDKTKKVDGYCGWRWVNLGGHPVKRIVVVAAEMAFVLPKEGFRIKQKRAIVISPGQVFKTQADAAGGVDREVFVVRGHSERMHYEKVKVRGDGELNRLNYRVVEPNGELRDIWCDGMFELESEAALFVIQQMQGDVDENLQKIKALKDAAAKFRKRIGPKRAKKAKKRRRR